MVGEPFGFFNKCAVCLCVQPKVYMYSEAKQYKKKNCLQAVWTRERCIGRHFIAV